MAKSSNKPGNDEDLDKLVRQAAVRHAGGLDAVEHTDTPTLMKQEQKKFYLKWGIIGTVTAVLLTIVVYMFVSSRMEASRKKEEIALSERRERERLAQLATDTEEEVDGALGRRDFAAARLAIDSAAQKGLVNEELVDLNAQVQRAANQERAKLVNQLEAKTDEREFEACEATLEKIRILDGVAGNDDRRTVAEQKYWAARQRAEEKEKKDKHRKLVEETRAVIDDSRAAATARDWDKAIQLAEKAKTMPFVDDRVFRWEEELRKMVGGRVLVRSNAGKFWITVAGGERVEGGTTVSGLPGEETEITVSSEGYIPEVRRLYVLYPEVKKIRVNLTPESARPLWSSLLLRDRCAQWAMEEFYMLDSENRKIAEALRKRLPPCESAAPASIDEEDFRKRLEKELDDVSGRSKPLIHLLRDLGSLLAKYPSAATIARGDDRFKSMMSQIATQLESGCGDCLGSGKKPCAECDGAGKRVEPRTCTACKGAGQKIHTTCKGTGKKKCKRCRGSGSTRENVPTSGKFTQSRMVTCRSCSGKGVMDCNGCQNGKVTCTVCKGTSKKDSRGTCSKCKGAGGSPCQTCGQTGARERMEAGRRKEMEKAAAAQLEDEDD